jgi:hypothetical protein
MEHLRGKKPDARCNALAIARRVSVCGASLSTKSKSRAILTDITPGDCRLQTSAEASHDEDILT